METGKEKQIETERWNKKYGPFLVRIVLLIGNRSTSQNQSYVSAFYCLGVSYMLMSCD